MKFEKLRQSLIKTSIVCSAILLVVAIAYYLISMKSDSLAEKVASLKAQKTGNETQYGVIEKQIADANEAKLYYESFKNSQNADPQNFRRDFAKVLLAQLKEKVGIVNLKFTMSQFEKLKGEYDKKYVAAFSSVMTIQFSANSDVDAYNLIKEICASFPGDVEIEEYKISRLAQIDNGLLIATSESGHVDGLVGGEVTLKWRGIQDNPDSKQGKTPAPAVTPGNPLPFNPESKPQNPNG